MSKQDTGKTPFSKERRRRSERLTQDQHDAFKKYVDAFDTQLDAVEALGFNSRHTLRNIYVAGSGHPDNISRIRQVIEKTQKSR